MRGREVPVKRNAGAHSQTNYLAWTQTRRPAEHRKLVQNPAIDVDGLGTVEISGNQGSEFGQAGTVPGNGPAMAAEKVCLTWMELRRYYVAEGWLYEDAVGGLRRDMDDGGFITCIDVER